MNRSEKKACKLCSIEASFYTDSSGETAWERYESSLLLATAPWTGLRACRYKDGRLALYGVGDNETNLYFPNFCPECGKPNKEVPE